jgi:hypothetical protein
MYTKPLIHQPITTLDPSDDLGVIRRLLVAAAINPRFCMALLDNPRQTVRDGFGGESFSLSERTTERLSSIRAATLPEFIQQLNDNLSNQLLNSEYIEAT